MRGRRPRVCRTTPSMRSRRPGTDICGSRHGRAWRATMASASRPFRACRRPPCPTARSRRSPPTGSATCGRVIPAAIWGGVILPGAGVFWGRAQGMPRAAINRMAVDHAGRVLGGLRPAGDRTTRSRWSLHGAARAGGEADHRLADCHRRQRATVAGHAGRRLSGRSRWSPACHVGRIGPAAGTGDALPRQGGIHLADGGIVAVPRRRGAGGRRVPPNPTASASATFYTLRTATCGWAPKMMACCG